tara:strand:+ start:255 stop:905 length:651 start_codon:yes stop_codon:yes gene_type:complete
MDGNNRWSKKNNFTLYNGYKKGAKQILNLTKFIFTNTKSNYVSAFALSKNNLYRSKRLISILKKLLLEFIDDINNQKFSLDFNVRFVGDKSFLDKGIIKKIDLLENTVNKNKKFLIIYINYSGKDDIKQAAHNYHSVLKVSKKNKYKFEDFLLTKNIPDPDILIRTGGYSRLSDFIIYQSSFSELFFSNKLWPDFKTTDLLNIINKYYFLERKFGL